CTRTTSSSPRRSRSCWTRIPRGPRRVSPATPRKGRTMTTSRRLALALPALLALAAAVAAQEAAPPEPTPATRAREDHEEREKREREERKEDDRLTPEVDRMLRSGKLDGFWIDVTWPTGTNQLTAVRLYGNGVGTWNRA